MPSNASPDFARRFTLASYISFLPIGVANVLLAPLLPVLSARWHLDYSQAGALFTAQYITSTVAVGLSGFVVAWRGFRFTVNIGLLLMSSGLAFLLSGSMWLGIACIGIIGAGIGLAVPAANLLVADVNPTRRSAALNTLNFCWSAGAVACPFLVAAAVHYQHLSLFLQLIPLLAIAVVFWIFLLPRPVAPTTTPSNPFAAARLRSAPFLILSALFFLYVGTENGFGGWVASYAKTLRQLGPVMSLITPAFFYASITLGRLLAPLLLRKVHEISLAQSGLFLACAGTAGLLFSHALPGVIASACAAGLGLSSVYPICIALLSSQFGADSSRIAGLMFVLSNIGGGLLPWIVGIWAKRSGSLTLGLLLPFLGCAIMLALYSVDWGQRKRYAEAK